MTSPELLLGANQRPLDGQHTASFDPINVKTLSPEQLDESFAKELAKINRFFEDNQAAYENRRRQLRQSPTNIRIISNEGRELLFSPSFGLESRGRGAPIFRYIAPRTNAGVRLFTTSIKFVVMHSFGRGYDFALMRKSQAKTIPIDPQTGHNPARFALGLRTLLKPQSSNITTIHHVNSLRGDLVNSVSWDNRCVHGEGGGISGINDASIGIEHEEWYANLLRDNRRPREIEDHGPFTEAQYAVDAFIIKKLESYTGETFTRYLGHGAELRNNIRNQVTGCFNHASSSRHADPGAEFFLPPGFELDVTNLSTIPIVRDRTAAWERRFAIWYADLPRGTKISAYDRIFDKVSRLRSFDIQTELFDPSLNNNLLQLTIPDITGDYAVAAAQKHTQQRLSALQRSEQMQSRTRSQTFSSAQGFNGTKSETWARQTSNLVRISQTTSPLPVVVNAVRLDSNTGTWVSTNTRNVVPSTSKSEATPTEDNPDLDATV